VEQYKENCWSQYEENCRAQYKEDCRSQWPRGLRRRTAAAEIVGLNVLSVFVLIVRGLCDELISPAEKSF